MIPPPPPILEDYLEYLTANRDLAREEFAAFEKKLREQNDIYKGEPLKTHFVPYFIEKERNDRIHRQAERMYGILECLSERYLENESLRRDYQFDPFLEDLILSVDPGYRAHLPLSRYDGYPVGKNGLLKYLEFNTDGTAGFHNVNAVEELFYQTKLYREFLKESRCVTTYPNLSKPLLETILSCYRESGGENKCPRIAIIDWKGVATWTEFVGLARRFRRAGYETVVSDPREVKLEKGRLMVQGAPVDIVYRRLLTWEMIERRAEIPDYVRAYKEQAACFVGSLRSEVAWSKLSLAILSNPKHTGFLTEDEKEFVAESVAWTARLREGEEALLDGKAVDVLDVALKGRERFVIKPHTAEGGRGIILGKMVDDETWMRAVDELAGDDYLLQEYQTSEMRPFLDLETGREIFLYVSLSPYVFQGYSVGHYFRSSPEPVIGLGAGGRTLISGVVESCEV